MGLVLDRAPKDMDKKHVWIRYPPFLDFVGAPFVVPLLGQGLDDDRAVNVG